MIFFFTPLAPSESLRSKFFQKTLIWAFQKMLILAFEANSALSRENETKIAKITCSAHAIREQMKKREFYCPKKRQGESKWRLQSLHDPKPYSDMERWLKRWVSPALFFKTYISICTLLQFFRNSTAWSLFWNVEGTS